MDTLTLIVAVLAIVIVLRLCLPNLLVVLGKSPLQNGFDAGAEALNPHLLAHLDPALFEDMTSLGFIPLGIYWEQMSFTRRFHEYVFIKPGENCYGLLYPSNQIRAKRAAFLTVFPSGAIAFTKNYAGGLEMHEADFIAEGAGDFQSSRPAPDPFSPEAGMEEVDIDLRVPLDVVFERHRETVNRFIFRGNEPAKSYDALAFVEAQHRYHSHPALRSKFRSTMLSLLVTKLMTLGVLPIILGARLGFDHLIPWLVLLGEGLIGLFLRYGFSSAAVIKILNGGSNKVPS